MGEVRCSRLFRLLLLEEDVNMEEAALFKLMFILIEAPPLSDVGTG